MHTSPRCPHSFFNYLLTALHSIYTLCYVGLKYYSRHPFCPQKSQLSVPLVIVSCGHMCIWFISMPVFITDIKYSRLLLNPCANCGHMVLRKSTNMHMRSIATRYNYSIQRRLWKIPFPYKLSHVIPATSSKHRWIEIKCTTGRRCWLLHILRIARLFSYKD